ncbi:MAG: thioredoxin-disulfide reductase [Clostridiaceae bacterium]|nr:thioredoxin-disulfide reductase [Clostridiaceae bacterium]
MKKVYDCIIIGGGPAGLSAGLYAARSKMDTIIIEKENYGGQIATTDEVDNYPGSMENATGPILVDRMRNQAKEFGTNFAKDEITEVDFKSTIKLVKGRKDTYQGKTVIIASGASPRLGGFKKELEFRGKGVSYCATCDADFFTDLEVVVIGGGDSAITESIYLTKFASKVTIIHRRSELRAAKSIQDKAFKNPKINFIWDTVVEEAFGEDILEKLVLRNVITGKIEEHKTDGVFVFVGYLPISEIFKGKIEMNEGNYILGDQDMNTNVPGVFVAGDIREKSLRQVITAAADGAIAATTAERYIENLD